MCLNALFLSASGAFPARFPLRFNLFFYFRQLIRFRHVSKKQFSHMAVMFDVVPFSPAQMLASVCAGKPGHFRELDFIKHPVASGAHCTVR